jgi:hypothetical protein
MFELVTPARAGVQLWRQPKNWISAFAGMTGTSNFTWPDQWKRR